MSYVARRLISNYLAIIDENTCKSIVLGISLGVVKFYTKTKAFEMLDKILKEALVSASSNHDIRSTLYTNIPPLLLLFTTYQLSSLIFKKIADNIDTTIRSNAIKIDKELSLPHKINAVRLYTDNYSKEVTDSKLFISAIFKKSYSSGVDVILSICLVLSSSPHHNLKILSIAITASDILYTYIDWKISSEKEIVLQKIQKTKDAIALADSALSNQDFISMVYLENNVLIRHKSALQERLIDQESSLFRYYLLISAASLIIRPLELAANIVKLYKIDPDNDNLALTIDQLFNSIKSFLDVGESLVQNPYVFSSTDLAGAKKAIELAYPQAALNSTESQVEINNNGIKSIFKYCDSAEKSIRLTGDNAVGKSTALKTLAGIETPELLENEPEPLFETIATLRHIDVRNITYIPQGSLAGLMEVTKHGNPAGITPLDIFTAFLSDFDKKRHKEKIKSVCSAFVQNLNIRALKEKDLSQPINFEMNPSGGEAQKMKFVMMAVTALYGDKELILIDEIYNDLSAASVPIVERAFIELLQDDEVISKFISVDHRTNIGDGLYQDEIELKAEELRL